LTRYDIKELETVYHIMTTIMKTLEPKSQLALALTLLDQARATNKMSAEEFVETLVPEMKKMDELFPFDEEEKDDKN